MIKILFVILAVLVSAGCITDTGNDNPVISNEVSEAEIPKECLEANTLQKVHGTVMIPCGDALKI